MSLLLTNGMLRMATAAVRSVGSRGVTVGVGDTSSFTPAAFSRYCRDRWVYPDPEREPEAFCGSLLDRIERRGYRVFFPMDIPALEIALDNRAELEALCGLPLPPTGSCRTALDKGLSALTAARAGVEAPATLMPGSPEEVPAMARRLGYPLVIKPRVSSGSRGIRIVHDDSRLMDHYLDIHASYPLPVLQACIPVGERYDVCLLYDRDGRLRASFTQKEIRHFPHPIGPSTMQESVWMPELVERAKAIMAHLPWYGVAELEFMIDPRDGVPKFMEINPRFWNSLQLSVRSGIDFPWLLYRLAIGEPIQDLHTYRIGQRVRTLFPGEVLHFATNPDRWRMDPPLLSGARRGGEDDILSLRDPMAAVGLAAAACRHLFDRRVWSKLLKR